MMICANAPIMTDRDGAIRSAQDLSVGDYVFDRVSSYEVCLSDIRSRTYDLTEVAADPSRILLHCRGDQFGSDVFYVIMPNGSSDVLRSVQDQSFELSDAAKLAGLQQSLVFYGLVFQRPLLARIGPLYCHFGSDAGHQKNAALWQRNSKGYYPLPGGAQSLPMTGR